MIALFLLLQATAQASPGDSAYSSPALRALVGRAAVANALPPPALRAYAAKFESELAVVKGLPGPVEGTNTVDQVGGEFRWDRAKGYGQHGVGYRQETTGVPLPTSSFLYSGWVIPNLYGPELKTFGNESSEPTVSITATPKGTEVKTLSPLASDRERIYHFSGGDTVTMAFPDGPDERLVRVRVEPRDDLPLSTQVFRGEFYLDPGTEELRRMRGQLLSVGGPPARGSKKLVAALVPSSSVMDVINRAVPGAGLVPVYQRFDLVVVLPFALDMVGAIRIVTRLHHIQVDTTTPAGRPSPLEPASTGVSQAPRDSLRAYRDWTASPTSGPSHVLISDLVDVGPVRFAPDGAPVLFGRGSTSTDVFRFDRVEGLFTGAVGTLRLRDALPGGSIRANAGYGWWNHEWRGGVVAALARKEWLVQTRAQAILDFTNKFADPQTFGPGIGAVLVNDNYDYVLRTQYGVTLARSFGRLERLRIRASADWVEDHTTVAWLTSGPTGQNYSPNPSVDPLDYLRTRAEVIWHPRISARFAEPGLGASALWEHGTGDQSYDRVQAYGIARANWRRFTFALVGNVGAVYSASPPTQQLILFGGSGSLPGYDWDQFGGDRAAVLKWMVNIPLPFLANPIKLGPRVSLPALAPNISIRFYGGWAEASNAAAAASLARLGTTINSDGDVVQYSVPTDGVKSSGQIRLSLFGSLIGLGLSKAFEPGTIWRFNVDLGLAF
jgi:hypothetical protein